MNNEQPAFSISLTEQEAGVLLNLLNSACLHEGRKAASAVAFFDNKISAAHAASKVPPATVPLDKPSE